MLHEQTWKSEKKKVHYNFGQFQKRSKADEKVTSYLLVTKGLTFLNFTPIRIWIFGETGPVMMQMYHFNHLFFKG